MTDRSEKSILNGALIALSREPSTLVWRNNTGQAWQGQRIAARVGQPVIVKPGMVILHDARPITFGLPGSADILGVSDGRAIGIETKTRTGKQRETQEKFQRAFEKAGGLYGLARSEDEALAILRKK